MSEQPYTRITLQSTTSYYSELETVEYSCLEVEVIRQLQDAGVIKGIEVSGEERRYSEEDLAVLRRARRLHKDLDINLEGIEIILRLHARLEAMQRELEHYRRKTR